MNDIEWQAIAKAIREKRLQDVSTEEWNLVADKIENKKRGKGRPREAKQEVIDQAVFYLQEVEQNGTEKEIKARVRDRIKEKHETPPQSDDAIRKNVERHVHTAIIAKSLSSIYQKHSQKPTADQ